MNASSIKKRQQLYNQLSVAGIGIVEMELRGTKKRHHRVEDDELASCESANHDTARREPNSCKLHEADLLCQPTETHHHGSLATSARLVYLGEERVRWVRDNCGSYSSDDTRAE